MSSQFQNAVERLLERKGGRLELRDIYRVRLGKRQGQQIWIVDGARVVRDIYPAFVMGGNDQRYRFNPQGEIWIDNRIGVAELEYTIAHELIERKLMRERGWSYDRAHSEGGLLLEKQLRQRERRRVWQRESSLGPGDTVSGTVCPNGIYRSLLRKANGLSIWVVDGGRVRRELDGDFCFGGHGFKYRFIAEDEIWLDSAMSVEEAHFALVHERAERSLMAEGKTYEKAYPIALALQLQERERQERLSVRHEAGLAPVTYGVRDRGVKFNPDR